MKNFIKLFLLVLIAMSATHAEESLGTQHIMGGAFHAVVYEDHKAYVGTDSGFLKVYNVTTPSQPKLTNQIELPQSVKDLFVIGSHIYVADGEGGIYALDKSTLQIVHHENLQGFTSSVRGIGSMLITVVNNQVKFFDISNMHSWQQKASLDVFGAINININGSYVYVACGRYGLKIIDIQNYPQSVSIAGSLSVEGEVASVTVSGNYAYLSNRTKGIQVVDISDPTHPSLVTTLENRLWLRRSVRSVVYGNYLYSVDGFGVGGMSVVDISNPTTPQFVTHLKPDGEAWDIDIYNHIAYIANDYGGLAIVNISDPSHPSLISEARVDFGKVRSLNLINNLLIVYDVKNGIYMTDIKDILHPKTIGHYDNPNIYFSNGDTHNTYVYVASGWQGFFIVDFSDPNNPDLITQVDTDGSVYDIKIKDNYAYVADYTKGVKVYDLSDIENPNLISEYDTDGSSWGVEIKDDYLYVADGSAGLKIFDISDPSMLDLIGSVDTTGSALNVTIKGDYAYVSDGTKGVQVINISQPNLPRIVATIKNQYYGYYENVFIENNTAYVAAGTLGVLEVDISNPTSPHITQIFDTKYAANDVVKYGKYLIVADSKGGVVAIKAEMNDTDGDGIPDVDDPDDDNDGISDRYEQMIGTDPLDPNSKPSDLDHDGIPDAYDSDRDGDGIANVTETAYGLNPDNPNDGRADSDGDGFDNALEISIGTNFRNAASRPGWAPIVMDGIVTFVPYKP